MKWEYSSADGYLVDELSKETGLSKLITRILINRGITTKSAVEDFFSNSPVLYDPFLMKDMDKAVERIQRALDEDERIAVFGDYDADGITATALVYTFLKSLGADIIYTLPERDDSGYGLNADTVTLYKEKNIDLVITVDTGITAFEETDMFNENGIDVVITDHHMPREYIPKAYAVVDPHREDCSYPYKNLAGVGVAYKLICALADNRKTKELLAVYSDMIALGSVADLVPVTDENRYLIKEGLNKINNNPNEGIKALIETTGYSGKEITVSGISFGLAPRVNAAGRVSSPLRALDLLLSTDAISALNFADILCRDNEHRRELEAEIFKNAVYEIENDSNISDRDILVVSGENWHQGVIGIVAAKIVEKYGKPVILLTNDGTVAQGSGRSVNGFNILEAISSCADILHKFGGHEFAAGVQLDAEAVDDFRERINEYTAVASNSVTEAVLKIDSGVVLRDVNLLLAHSISLLEPFGVGNEQPVLAMTNVIISSILSVGKGKHLKVNVTDGNGFISVMFFSTTLDKFPYSEGDRIDIAFTLSTNVWNGRETVSVSAMDSRPSSSYLKADSSLSLYGNESIPKDMLPCMQDFRDVYSYIEYKRIKCFDLYILSDAINIKTNRMTALKLRIIIDVFTEMGIMSSYFKGTKVEIKVNPLKTKVRLEEAPTSVKYSLFDQ